MTFHEPNRRKPILAVAVVVFVAIMSIVFFFSFKECGRSGILRSGKTSDATSLYQVLPVDMNGKNYLLSLEGVFKTRIYERSGGFTQRSGSTDVRLTLRDLSSGEQIKREVLGNYPDALTKIVGVGNNIIWLYNKKDGLHGINLTDFETIHTQENIINANSDLSEGVAMANDYLGNLEELFGYNKYSNTLKITTITGKPVYVDAKTFATTELQITELKTDNFNTLINDIVEKAKMGETPQLDQLYEKIMEKASDLNSFSDIGLTSKSVTGIDSCTYTLEGNSVRTITKSDCIEPVKKIVASNTTGKYIEPVFLSDYDTEQSKFINPNSLGADHVIIFHSDKIGDEPNLLMSLVNTNSLKADYSVKTGIVLGNYRSSFNISGSFFSGDTLFIGIDNQLLCVNIKTGKIFWRNIISKDDYYAQLYYLGTAIQKEKRFFITANSYFTKLSQDGIFVNGRTDYQLTVIDAATGKEVKRLDATKSNPETLPYYLGMSDGKCWFYSKTNSIHTRSLPDLKIIENNFELELKNAGVSSPLVTTSKYSDAIEEKYIAMDAKQNHIYVTTQNGLHYEYDLLTKKIAEVEAPETKNYENWMRENPFIEFYSVCKTCLIMSCYCRMNVS